MKTRAKSSSGNRSTLEKGFRGGQAVKLLFPSLGRIKAAPKSILQAQKNRNISPYSKCISQHGDVIQKTWLQYTHHIDTAEVRSLHTS